MTFHASPLRGRAPRLTADARSPMPVAAGRLLPLSAAAFGATALASVVAATALPSIADAAVTRATVAGPSADLQLASIQKVDVDVAPDGSAAIAWRQKVGGVDHAFVSRYVSGTWTTAQRVDSALATPSAQPAVAVGNGGRTLVVFPNGTVGNERLYAAYAPDAATPLGAKIDVQLDPAGWKDVDLDLAPTGDGYLTVYEGFHLRAYRVQGGATFTPVGDGFPGLTGILNGNATEQAESGDQRGAHLAVDPTGATATFAWSETNGASGYKPWARRVTGTTPAQIGTAVDASIATLDGKPGTGGANDMTSVAVGGDGKAWVAYRAAFTYGGSDRGRAIVRSFDGTTLGAPQVIDGLGASPAEAAEFPRLAANASGHGLAASYRQLTFGTEAATLPAGGAWTTGSLVSSGTNTTAGRASVALADSGVGLVAMHSTAEAKKQVFGRIAGGPASGALETLSDPAFGDAGSPLEAGAGGGYAITAFQQGTAATTRIVAAVVPLPAPAPPQETPGGGGGTGTGGNGPATTPTPAPALSQLGLRRKGALTATGAAPRIVSATAKTRTLRFTLDRPATVELSVKRVRPGKLVRGTCTSTKGRPVKTKDRCDVETRVPGAATLAATAGTTHVRFGGRATSGKPLAPGTYALYAVARDAAGTGQAARLRFTLKRAR